MTFAMPHGQAVPSSEGRVATPLGAFVFRAFEGGEPLEVRESFATEGGIELRRYDGGELLLLPFVATLRGGRQVDGCVAAVWRVEAQADATFALRAKWEPAASFEEGGGAGGEHLTALTWTGPDAEVSLGSTDEERLSYVALAGFLPARLVSVFREEGANNVRFVGESDGLEIVLPTLHAGEAAQLHMIVAWRTGKPDDSTWFAVDVSPEEVSRRVDEALGS